MSHSLAPSISSDPRVVLDLLSRVALFTAMPGLALGRGPESSSALHRPNIVFIRADDQTDFEMRIRRPDNGQLVMQNVHDLLARKGVTFTNSFVSDSLCAPSRASFLSGQYAHNHHVLTNGPPDGGYGAFDHTNSLPVWLKKAGYRNVHVGKYINGYATGEASPPGWDDWFTASVSEYFNYPIADNGSQVFFGQEDSDYTTDVLTRKAVEAIHGRPDPTQPLFLVVDYIAPHKAEYPAPNTGHLPIPAPRHATVFEKYAPAWPPSFNEADVSDKPPWIQSAPRFDRHEADTIVAFYRARLGTELAVDEGVAKIVRALGETGELDNTVIIYTSDNGFEQGEHRIGTGKGSAYEESIRVPLVVAGPGFLQGRSCESIVANIDLAPTIVEIAGATAGRIMDGRSLVPLLDGSAESWSRDLLIETFGSYPTFSAIRSDRYLFNEIDLGAGGGDHEREFYLFRADPCRPLPDPFELESQHRNPCYDSLMRRLHDRLLLLKSSAGASGQ